MPFLSNNLIKTVISIMLLLTVTFSEDSRKGDSLALIDIAGPNGLSVAGWFPDYPLDDWKNISLNEDGRVDSIKLGIGLYLPDGLPSSIKNLQHLKYIYLPHSSLKSLPDEIGELKNLEVLILKDNSFETINPAIGKLENLKNLSFGFNKLNSLPESIGNLKNLEYLTIRNNNLTTLPESIGNLVNLKVIWAAENKITHLPESFGNLDSLTTLWMHDNRISDLPKSIINLDPDDRCTFGGNCLDSLKLDNNLLDWLDTYAFYWREDQDVSIIQNNSTLQNNAPLIRVANKKLYLPQDLDEGAVVRIISVDGKLLKKYSSLATNLIDLVDFSNGLYLVKIELMNKEHFLYRVKNH